MDKRLFRAALIISLLSLGGGLLLFPQLPAYVPTHWNFYGEVDGFGSKYFSLFFLALPLPVLLALRFFPALDPRGQNHRRSPKAYNIISAGVLFGLLGLGWIFYLPGLGLSLPVERLIMLPLGIMLIVLGNFMPQIRSNYFMGIRTPWALSNDVVWRKTNRAGGFVFCIAGILMIVSLFLPPGLLQSLPIYFLLVSTLGVYIYSYLIYKKLQKCGDAEDRRS